MKSFTTLLDEKGVNLVSALVHASRFGFVCDIVAKNFFFIFREQVWNLTGVEQVVDVFKEIFTDDLVVRKQELLLFIFLHHALFQQFFDTFLEVFILVVLCDFDLERLHVLVHKCSKLRHRFPARTTHTNKQCVSSGLPENTRNSRQVLNAVKEKHQIHFSVLLIVRIKHAGKVFDELAFLLKLRILAPISLIDKTKEDVFFLFLLIALE